MTTDRPLIAVAMLLLGLGFAFAGRRRQVTMGLTVGATALLTGMLTVRWVVASHPPVFGTFEMDLAETTLLLGLAVVIWRRESVGTGVIRAALLFALLTLAHTFLLEHAITPVTISEQTLLADLHAVLAWLAWVFYAHACFLAFRLETEHAALRLLGIGFVAQSAMAFVGIYLATLLFATPWSWDPVQILGLATWILVALALHLRLFFRVTLWRQRYFVVFLLLLYILSAKLIMFLPSGQSFHVFELGSMAVGMP